MAKARSKASLVRQSVFLGGRFLKRAWTKKVKAVSDCAIKDEALEANLKPVQPKVKLRLFRTSAAMIGLTVSIGTPNLLLTLGSNRAPAAQVPPADEPATSMAAPTLEALRANNLAPEPPVQIAPASAPIEVRQAQKLQPQVVSDRLADNQTKGQVKLKAQLRRTAPLPVVQPPAPKSIEREVAATSTPPLPEPNYLGTPQTIESAAPAVVTNTDLGGTIASNPQPATQQAQITPTDSRVNRLVERLQANKNAANGQFYPTQNAPIVQPTARQLAAQLQPEKVNLEANSAWTAKQRLLVERLRQKKQSSQLSSASATPGVNLAQPQPNSVANHPLQSSNNVVVEAQPVPAVPTTASNTPQLPIAATNSDTQLAARSQQPKSSVERLVERLKLSSMPTAEPDAIAPNANEQNSSAAADNGNTSPSEEAIALDEKPAVEEQQTPIPSTAFVLPAENLEVAPKSEVEVAAQSPAPVSTEPVSPNSAAVASVTMEVPDADGSKAAPVPEYQVKPGDTLSAIATKHKVSIPEIINANRLGNPDLLLVDQRIKLPSLAASTAEKVTVAVLPEIKPAPTASAPVPQTVAPSDRQSNQAILVSTNSDVQQPTELANSYNGVGGSFVDEVDSHPLSRAELSKLQAQYAQKLQSDVHKLQNKYSLQNNSSSSSAPVAPQLPALIKPQESKKLAVDEPVNPDFVVAQTAQDLKQPSQKQLPVKANYSVPPQDRVATAHTDISPSDSYTGQQVTPDLPPLAPVDNYLPHPNGSGAFKGYIWPAKGVLSSGYGWRWGRMHRGIDIAAPVGTPVFAAAEGVVVKSGWNKGGYGNLVDIQHADGTLTRYAHNYRVLVQPGQQVEQGQQISLMGSTGRSTGPHLHFEVHPGGKAAVNPIALLPKK